MAHIEIVHPENEDTPGYVERVEVRVWAPGGTENQPFYIGSGLNYHANDTLWIEIMYCVDGAQVFYTRNFLQVDTNPSEEYRPERRLDEMLKEGSGKFVLVGCLPETCISFEVEKFGDDDGHVSHWCTLNISADTGVVFGRTGPGSRSIDLIFHCFDLEEEAGFMRDLIHEIEAVCAGKHPDPADYPEGSSEWPFLEQLNRQAYNRIAVDYQENYFEHPLLADIFDRWMKQLPQHGHVLDAGCGHGMPVIAGLLEGGFEVTGSDLSPAMLEKAAGQFPQVNFIQQATTNIRQQSVYDGICSFNSMVYLDPIDLLNAIRRAQIALKPGGLLFLFGYDSGPDWRGEPFGFRVGQWMWAWHYGMDELAGLLEEHGYFKVLDKQKVIFDPEEAERLAREEAEQIRAEADRPDSDNIYRYPSRPPERSPYAYALIARRCNRSVKKSRKVKSKSRKGS